MSNLVDKDAEMILLGSLMNQTEKQGELAAYIKVEDLFFDQNQTIYMSILDEINHSGQPDPLIIASRLQTQNLLEKAGGRSYIMEVASKGVVVGVMHFAERIRDLSQRRKILSGFQELQKRVPDTSLSLQGIINDAESALSLVADRESRKDVQHLRALHTEFMEFYEKSRTRKGQIGGTPTHFKRLDDVTDGFKGGQLIILAARPGVGKTTLALNIMMNMALKGKLPVVIYSLEMSRLQLLLRMICASAFIDAKKAERGLLNNSEWEKALSNAMDLFKSDIYIDESTDLSAWDFRHRTRKLSKELEKAGKKLGIVVVDYLQLMTDRDSGRESRQVEVSSISRTLKTVAKEMNVPVLALSQMNRSIEQRGRDQRPMLSDLRESGAIEQDADMVIFIHREDYGKKEEEVEEAKRGLTEVIVAKNRGGAPGVSKMDFKKNMNMFLERDPDMQDP